MSETYKQAGVDIAAGDAASSAAGKAAKTTFAGRAGKIGEPVDLPGGFAGILNFGDYYVVQCCDTVGTKIDLAEKTGDFSGLGYDLLAMVADDAACLGAEVVSVTNTFETKAIDSEKIKAMMNGLAKACREQKIVIAGGEIAEVGAKINGTSWGADAIGVVKKDRVVTGENIAVGDLVITLKETSFRCNGYSLVRKILKEHAPDNIDLMKRCAAPSTIYHDALLHVLGRFDEERKAELTGIAHITGGGIPGNIVRILRTAELGVRLNNLFPLSVEMKELAEMGNVPEKEIYEVWNAGNGMMVSCRPENAEKILALFAEKGMDAQIAGEITNSGKIELQTELGEFTYKKV